jgi:murein DD-endopeptidase MepM/ murein hydrolase activator NlpD
MLASLLACKWLLASASCMAAGAAVWLLLNTAARRWPALHTSRNLWLAAQSVVVAAALLPFLPAGPQTAWVAQITLPASAAMPHTVAAAAAMSAPATPAASHNTPMTMAARLPAAPSAGAANRQSDATATATATATSTSTSSIAASMPLQAALWLLLYGAGLAWTVARQIRARQLWRSLLATARPMSNAALQAHPAFSAAQLRQIAARRLKVMRTDAAISPMLIGVRKPLLLLPARLDTLTIAQQQMIIAHELHHLQARDPLCLAIAAVWQTVFWFNPTLRWMARQMEWALELNCDQHVLAGRAQHQRKQYALSLLQQWSALQPAAAAAFGGATVSARLRHMQQDGLPALSRNVTYLIAATLVAILACIAALQPALAISAATPAAPTTAQAAEPPAGAAIAWQYPLDNMRVTSFFGVHREVLPTPHKGIDLAARKGTPVHASANGTIIAAGPLAENHGRYGNAVIIEHGAQRSLYAHLDSVNVTPGQRVVAGQLIGKVGETGFATGPHLHLEIRRNDQLIDPATVLANLDTHATPRALRVRRQQLATTE